MCIMLLLLVRTGTEWTKHTFTVDSYVHMYSTNAMYGIVTTHLYMAGYCHNHTLQNSRTRTQTDAYANEEDREKEYEEK